MKISVIICGHQEGRLLHRTLKSVFKAIDYAAEKGLMGIEVIVSLDNPSEETLHYLKTSIYVNHLSIYKNHFEDVGLSRNFAVKKAKGEFIAFLDGDDLFCKNWLFEAFSFFKKTLNKNQIVHPEYLINFEKKSLIWKRISSNDPNFRYGTMLYANCWDLTCFLPKFIALLHPFSACPRNSGWGMEDYHFFLETLGSGVEHVVIPQTAVYIRVKSSGSRLAEHTNDNAIPQKNSLFFPTILKKYISKESPSIKKNIEEKINLKHLLLKPFPRLHLFLYRVKLFLLRKYKQKRNLGIRNRIPEWLEKDWREMNTIEPALFPTIQTLLELHRYDLVYSDTLASTYLSLCDEIGENVTHMILVPFIKMGGAEKVLFNFIKTLKFLYKKDKIVVVSTESSDSPWKSKLPDDVAFVDIGNLRNISYTEKEILLREILIELSPKFVYNLSSQLAFIVYTKYGKALSSMTDLYTFVFCQEYGEEGQIDGYAFRYLDKCINYIKKIFTDNQRYIDLLCDTYGFETKKFTPLYQPINNEVFKERKIQKEEKLKLIWAGRLDSQKHPEILCEIALACKDLSVHFDVYGAKVLDTYFDIKRFSKIPNITYKGAYTNGFEEVAGNYDGMIYTSEYDGMPNIILEAIENGLPIISSNVGGIGELLKDKHSALLVSNYDDIQEYREKIKFALAHRQEFANYAKVGLKDAQKKHSWDNLSATVALNLENLHSNENCVSR